MLGIIGRLTHEHTAAPRLLQAAAAASCVPDSSAALRHGAPAPHGSLSTRAPAADTSPHREQSFGCPSPPARPMAAPPQNPPPPVSHSSIPRNYDFLSPFSTDLSPHPSGSPPCRTSPATSSAAAISRPWNVWLPSLPTPAALLASLIVAPRSPCERLPDVPPPLTAGEATGGPARPAARRLVSSLYAVLRCLVEILQ